MHIFEDPHHGSWRFQPYIRTQDGCQFFAIFRSRQAKKILTLGGVGGESHRGGNHGEKGDDLEGLHG